MRRFAAKYGINYSLLSDEGSRVITDLGMLDADLAAHHAAFGRQVQPHQWGVAYPGVFVLDSQGVVVAKRFQENYRQRESGDTLLEEALGLAVPRHVAEETRAERAVTVHAFLGSPTYRFYERVRLIVDLAIAPAYHVYGQPIPEGFVPLTVTVAPLPGLQVGEAQLPEPHRFKVEGLDEEFWVLDGTIRGVVPLVFTMPPGSGKQSVEVTVSYQACSDTVCLIPAHDRFTLSIQEALPVEAP